MSVRRSCNKVAINKGWGYPPGSVIDDYVDRLRGQYGAIGQGSHKLIRNALVHNVLGMKGWGRTPRLKKGSKEAKEYMARLRAMRGMKGSGKVRDFFKNLFKRGKDKVKDVISNPEKIKRIIDTGMEQLSDPNSKFNELYGKFQNVNLPGNMNRVKNLLDRGVQGAKNQVSDPNSQFNKIYKQANDPNSQLSKLYKQLQQSQWQKQKDRNQVMFDNQFYDE